ncbi:MAG: hypothetical protein Phyf2KO_04150 [Phycisphaerales bacterium]
MPAGNEPIELLLRATARSRISAAAKQIFWGNYGESQQILANVTDDLEAIADSSSVEPNAYLGGDDALGWAERYLSARQNIPVRQALLSELTRRRGRLGPVAAEALVRDAVFGTPAAVRAQASEVVLLYADSPAITNAVLEILPRIPKVEQSNIIIDRITNDYLPAATDPEWLSLARQRLVETLLRQLSGVGEGYVVDQYVNELVHSYRIRLGSVQAETTPAPAIELIELAHQLYNLWENAADEQVADSTLPHEIEELHKRRIGRVSLSKGLIARFAVEQVSQVEAMALVVRSERPDASGQVDQVLLRMNSARRSSANILYQIMCVETAAVELWQIRLGEQLS